MADRYWVGGTGSWQDTTKWSDITGGSGGFSVPTVNDNVYVNGDSDLDAPFKIAISLTNASALSLTVISLSYSLSLRMTAVKTFTTKRFNILDIKTYVNAGAAGTLYVDGNASDTTTNTYNSIVPLHNLKVYLTNTKLKSDLSISNSVSYGTSWDLFFIKNCFIDNKLVKITNAFAMQIAFSNTGSAANSIAYSVNFTNSKIVSDGGTGGIAFNFDAKADQRNYTSILPDFTNSFISLSTSACNIFAYLERNKEFILPSINYIDKSPTGGPVFNLYTDIAQFPLEKTVARIPRLSYARRSVQTAPGPFAAVRLAATQFPGTGKNIGNPSFYIGKLAISASALGKVIFSGANSYNLNIPDRTTHIFIESASLSQVIFHRIHVTGFRELSASFSASNIGYFNSYGPNNKNIKFPDPKTVYWNNATGGKLYSNSYTSATGGTVSPTWYPFPQDLVKITDTGLNTSATISLNVRGTIVFPSISSLDRTLPMAWQTSLSVNTVYFAGAFKAASNHTFAVTAATAPATAIFFGSGTFDVKPTINFPITFSGPGQRTIKSKITSTRNITILDSNINFNENSISCSRFTYTKTVNDFITSSATNLPKTIKFAERLTPFIDFPNTDFYFRTVATTNNVVQGNSDSITKIKSLYLEGGSLSYSIILRNIIVDNLIYNKTGNINIGLDPFGPITVKHIKMMGLDNYSFGSITASIRFTSTNASLTAVITYAGIDAVDSLSFVNFTRVVFEPRLGFPELTYRVFGGTRVSVVSGGGVFFSDKPKINTVNDGNNVASSSVFKILTNTASGFTPVFSSTYKDLNLSNVSLSNTTTYIATMPNYFSNNIKVGAPHKLKIIRGN